MRTVLVLALLAACNPHFHRDRNAPGITDVDTPPEPRDTRRVPPEDPGEEMLSVNPGVLFGGGWREVSPHGFGELGFEVSLVRGSSPHSHSEDGFLVYPVQAWGVALGWSSLVFDDDDDDLEVGPLYLEAYKHEIGSAGGGYAWNPSTGDHGPQIFAGILSLYARARYMWDAGTEISLGFQGKLPVVWVWSR